MGCQTTHTTDIETTRNPYSKKSSKKGCCSIDMNVSGEYSEYQITQQRGKRYMKKRSETNHNQQTKSRDRKQSQFSLSNVEIEKAVTQKNEIDQMKMSISNKAQVINESESVLEVVDEININKDMKILSSPSQVFHRHYLEKSLAGSSIKNQEDSKLQNIEIKE